MYRSLNAGHWQLRALVYGSCLLTIVSLIILKGGARVAAAPGEEFEPLVRKASVDWPDAVISGR